MIIFDLDGTLADCEHRRHFVDPRKHWDYYNSGTQDKPEYTNIHTGEKFKPDYKSFYEACDKDTLIKPVFEILCGMEVPYEIWSGRCESVRKKTEDWLCQFMARSEMPDIKMRPIGDNRPAHVIKEEWLKKELYEVQLNNFNPAIRANQAINMVFESDPESIDMYRKHGIFVLDCRQG